ncbi:2-oxoglutarate dehydrogenase E1 component [Cupriavidus metallidurans]|jgi:2-oxoglutarate dehydrogenase E1 component|uniref:2-oxoglutarate dehydrogenase E1 component n=1 Tax=Cupriavidus metallidurans (strain ATCC 43123 / DSM 2839 / NBRC 102507 / CH34) TaxID=266264 RepID=Q1LLP7_CUPMC|nr:2-oxoglutarate dehydrogenase E1 component [Cupriavidus metallidurans]ABF08929.1 2-oxoglutarate decarboxylase, thiamin-requiring (E1 component) [Cupriavidus metallidurans CH34]AVA36143.1 2-oxoglutarate dehydrogenase E1 component [Cupriavidus metallidurans]KWW37779.1 2-oxoglutarate dehydrogenase E1 component [Cupriavidus metallidurans]MDE4918422.1 2-oxoglutarate dehydrogenase E1 component [Cupriavidus metallidurans]QGS30169.1 2-oxoglutarate dehydrogenase E1 component [Cupriavidus metalliduran
MMQQYQSNSYLFGGNAPYVEELYEAYLQNPSSVPDNWRAYFDAMQNVPAADGSNARDIPHAPIVASFAERAKQGPIKTIVASADSDMGRKRVAATQLIAAYRNIGSHWADLDPLKRQERPPLPDLDPAFYGFSEADLDIVFNASNTYFGKESMSLRELLNNLRETYCGTIGAEFMYVSDQAQKRWWQERLETTRSKPVFTLEKKKHILDRLTAAEGLERFLHTKYVGQKRFSLEGGESFIAAMDELIQHAGTKGVQEIVIGMAHRGRLNVLVNTLGKMPADLFAEFEGKHVDDLPAGDVKYHKGFSSDVSTEGGPVHLSLAFNPSHLEIVNPVVEGSSKARQERRGDVGHKEVLPVQVHGDAAFAGQGVVMETLNLAQTRGYGTGGTMHLVINNQIGFTTSDPRDARSTLYCTDVVKMIEAPVLHVNGDDPEAVVYAMQLAVDFRMEFNKDVVVDIICFRKLGHNEQDTPAMTQPLMYKKIGQHPGTRKLYADKLVAQSLTPAEFGDELVKDYRAAMDAGKHTVDPVLSNFKNKFAVDWMPFLNRKWTDAADTAVPMTELKRLAERITTIPEHFKLHPLVEKVVKDRSNMGRGEQMLDWGMGEHLAFASLVASGYPVRITGQDAGRGTFTHRHAVLHDQARERWDAGSYVPLQNVSENQAPFTVIDSVLSEEAVLGFEYGYSTAEPNALVIWEAQFGDFVNGAQVVIDQFISSGEVKWGRASGLTMMLPHGYEGQGPEHSSARIERFLQLCADHNIQVVQPTTPAQIFHLLRRQMIRLFRKPLVIMTPKSLLRSKDAVSPLSDLAKGHFETVIPDHEELNASKVKRVIMCSGKVYYDLVNTRRERGATDTAIIRMEQLYPFPHKAVAAELKKYPGATEILWCQDEPQNQGAWFFVQHYIMENMTEGQKLGYAGRPASASPAVGYYAKHNEQQKALLDAAFSKLKGFVLTK